MTSPMPTGTLTFLFTDIEGSTRLWDEDRSRMRFALARHDRILIDIVEAHDGYIFHTGGDGFGAAFLRAGAPLPLPLPCSSRWRRRIGAGRSCGCG